MWDVSPFLLLKQKTLFRYMAIINKICLNPSKPMTVNNAVTYGIDHLFYTVEIWTGKVISNAHVETIGRHLHGCPLTGTHECMNLTVIHLSKPRAGTADEPVIHCRTISSLMGLFSKRNNIYKYVQY